MNSAPKIHIGLICLDKHAEASIKEAATQVGGSYVHTSKSMLELYQKTGLQKVQLILYVSPAGETGVESQALVQFFRSKKDFSQLPICILTDSPNVQMNRLLKDSRVRGFSILSGAFLALLTMQPLVSHTADTEFIEPISLPWIQQEFLESLQSKVGQGSQFVIRNANDDDLHKSFFCQYSDEVRSHLGWFKFAARFQEGTEGGMKTLFQDLSPDSIEEMAQILLTAIVTEFKAKAEGDLHSRGAIFYPPIEELQPTERKIIYSGSRSSGLLFESVACSVLLEVIQYI